MEKEITRRRYVYCSPRCSNTFHFFHEPQAVHSATFATVSTGEIVIILFVYLLFFGAKGIPSLAQTLGKAVYQFRNATKDVQDEIMKGAQEVRKQTSALRLDQIDIEDAPAPRKPAQDTSSPTPPTPESNEKGS
jgi:sec-independent protein translocase protein TatA